MYNDLERVLQGAGAAAMRVLKTQALKGMGMSWGGGMPQKPGCGTGSGFPCARGWGRGGRSPPGPAVLPLLLIGRTAGAMMSSPLKGKTGRKWDFVPIIEPLFTVVVKSRRPCQDPRWDGARARCGGFKSRVGDGCLLC